MAVEKEVAEQMLDDHTEGREREMRKVDCLQKAKP